jgi:hypothetical protein
MWRSLLTGKTCQGNILLRHFRFTAQYACRQSTSWPIGLNRNAPLEDMQGAEMEKTRKR